jgi:hypothetical protein
MAKDLPFLSPLREVPAEPSAYSKTRVTLEQESGRPAPSVTHNLKNQIPFPFEKEDRIPNRATIHAYAA